MSTSSVARSRRLPRGRRPEPQLGHACQPYRGYDDARSHHSEFITDPEFPTLYKRDPWCWSPKLGFHRTRTPHLAHALVGTVGKKYVGPTGMKFWQALRLGAGWGTSTEPCGGGWTEQTWRVFEAVNYEWTGDLEPVARLGQLVGELVDGGGQNRIADDDSKLQSWFRDAILEFLPHPGLGDWNEVLLRACHGDSAQDRDWVKDQEPPPAPTSGPWHLRRQKPRDARIYVWEYMTGDRRHNGGMRSICETYRMTNPTDAQAMQWMVSTIRYALRWGAAG